MENKKESIVTLATGIAGLVCGMNGFWSLGIFGVIGLACSIVGLVFSKKAYAAGPENKMLKIGKILAIIGLVLSIVGLVGGIICACTCGTLAASGQLEEMINY